MEPSPATPALGPACNATKDSGTSVWVEGGQGRLGHLDVPGNVPSFPQRWWVGVRGHAPCVCHSSHSSVTFLPV